MDYKRKHLIIQGPIISKGVSGSLNYDDLVVFNCLDNIKHLLSKFEKLFDSIVIATWINEPIGSDDLKEFNSVELLKIDDKQLISEMKSNGLNIEKENRFLNFYKQFYSLKKGCEALNINTEEDLVVKIRTDMYVDLDLLLKEALIREKNCLYIPGFVNNEIPDYYFASSYYGIINLCNAIFDCARTVSLKAKFNVHIYIPYSLYCYNNKELTLFEKNNLIYLRSLYPKFLFQGKELVKNTSYAFPFFKYINETFLPLSENLFSRIVWRGVPINYKNFNNSELTFKFQIAEKANYISSNKKVFFVFHNPALILKKKINLLKFIYPLLVLILINKNKKIRSIILKKWIY